MTSPSHYVRPPRLAVWLLTLFAFAEEADAILGDLLEEFSLLVSESDVASARRWYWRQTLKTVPRIAGAGVRTAPWLTGAAVAGGFLLRRVAGLLVEPAIFAVLDRYQVFQRHFNAYLFFASTGIDIGHIITFLFAGFIVALAARRNEIVATITLAMIYGAMAIVGSVYALTRTGDYELLWRLTWYLADCFAIVIAGGIVRTHRLGAAARPSNA